MYRSDGQGESQNKAFNEEMFDQLKHKRTLSQETRSKEKRPQNINFRGKCSLRTKRLVLFIGFV